MSIVYLGTRSPHNRYGLSQEAIGALLGSYIYSAPDRPRVLLPSCSFGMTLIASLERRGLVEDSGYRRRDRSVKEGIVWKLTPLGIEEYKRLLEMHMEEDEL